MSDQQERQHPEEGESGAEQRDEETEMRPLPDGGLGENMPDWLRRPPAWRALPSPEISPVPDPDPEMTRPDLPPVDTSEIDPTSLIEFDDLPEWLRDLGVFRSSVDEPQPEEPPAVVPADQAADAIGEADEDSPPATGPSPELPSVPSAPDEIEPSASASEGVPPSVPAPVADAPPETARAEGVPTLEAGSEAAQFWQRGIVVLLLVVALVISIAVAILLASGVL